MSFGNTYFIPLERIQKEEFKAPDSIKRHFDGLNMDVTGEKLFYDDNIYHPFCNEVIGTITPFYFVRNSNNLLSDNIQDTDACFCTCELGRDINVENMLSIIIQNITVIFNTGIWPVCKTFIYPEKLNDAYNLFYEFTVAVDATVREQVYALMHCVDCSYENEELSLDRVTSLAINHKLYALNDISTFGSRLIVDLVNHGYVNIEKVNRYFVGEYEYATRQREEYNYKDDLASYNHFNKALIEYDPSMIISGFNTALESDIRKISDIFDMNFMKMTYEMFN